MTKNSRKRPRSMPTPEKTKDAVTGSRKEEWSLDKACSDPNAAALITHLGIRTSIYTKNHWNWLSVFGKNLTTITITTCMHNDELERVLSLTPNLTKLHFSSYRATKISALCQCPLLEDVELFVGFKLTDITTLSLLPRLKRLGLIHCQQLGDSDLRPLAECPCLEEIRLYGASSLKSVASLGACFNLKRVDLSRAINLKGISPLRACKNLTEVNLSRCRDLKSVKPLGACKNLTKVNLSRCPNLKDIEALGLCPHLETVNVAYNGELGGFWALRVCYRLRKLDASFTYGTARDPLDPLDLDHCDIQRDAVYEP